MKALSSGDLRREGARQGVFGVMGKQETGAQFAKLEGLYSYLLNLQSWEVSITIAYCERLESG